MRRGMRRAHLHPFRVSAEGKALANAAVGQLAQVRTNAGQTVSGIAKADGTVEVNF